MHALRASSNEPVFAKTSGIVRAETPLVLSIEHHNVNSETDTLTTNVAYVHTRITGRSLTPFSLASHVRETPVASKEIRSKDWRVCNEKNTASIRVPDQLPLNTDDITPLLEKEKPAGNKLLSALFGLVHIPVPYTTVAAHHALPINTHVYIAGPIAVEDGQATMVPPSFYDRFVNPHPLPTVVSMRSLADCARSFDDLARSQTTTGIALLVPGAVLLAASYFARNWRPDDGEW